MDFRRANDLAQDGPGVEQRGGHEHSAAQAAAQVGEQVELAGELGLVAAQFLDRGQILNPLQGCGIGRTALPVAPARPAPHAG